MEKKNEQSLGDFIRDVERKGRRLNVNFVDRKKIILRNISEQSIELKYCVRMTSNFCKETIEIIEEVEKNFYEEKEKIKKQKRNKTNEITQNLEENISGEKDSKTVQQKKQKIKWQFK